MVSCWDERKVGNGRGVTTCVQYKLSPVGLLFGRVKVVHYEQILQEKRGSVICHNFGDGKVPIKSFCSSENHIV